VGSGCSKKLGEPYELKLVDIWTGEQKSPSYLAINPAGKVPALRGGAQVLRIVAPRTAAHHPPVVRALPSLGLPELLAFQQSSVHSQTLPCTL
jgi:glutathione S-transferase